MEFLLFMLGHLPLDVNYQHGFSFSHSLEYYQHRPLMFQQQQILYKDNMELGHCGM